MLRRRAPIAPKGCRASTSAIRFANNIIPAKPPRPGGQNIWRTTVYWARHVNASGNPVTNIITNWQSATPAPVLPVRPSSRPAWTPSISATSRRFFAQLHALVHRPARRHDPFDCATLYPIQYAPQKWHNQQIILNDSYSFSPTTIAGSSGSRFLRQLRQPAAAEPQDTI